MWALGLYQKCSLIPVLNRLVLLAVAAAAVLTIASFSFIPSMLAGENSSPDPVPESEALDMPVSLAALYTEADRRYNTLDGSYAQVQENVIDTRRHCEFCTVVELRQGSSNDAVDVSWSALRNFNIEGAKKVTFYVMGEEGDESIVFKGAGKKVDRLLDGKPSKVLDFDVKTKPVKLSKEWQKLEVDLSGANMRGVTNPFGVGLEEGQNTGPVRIFIKGMILEDEPADNGVPLEEEEQEQK
jgi:hypothetical protein